MNADPNDFESLRKLIALKRHEQPPPGYFDRLPRQILARLENEPASFWERISAGITFRPAYAYAFGFAVCGSLILGVGYSLKNAPGQTAARPLLDESPTLAHTSGMTKDTRPLVLGPLQPVGAMSTNPLFQAQQPKPYFNGLRPHVESASFQKN